LAGFQVITHGRIGVITEENRILRSHLPARLRLSAPERSTLAEMGKRLGRRGLEQVAGVAQPDTILAWYRRLIARKFDGSKRRSYPGRPTLDGESEALIVRMARENSGWGYDRIVGALANLGHRVSDQTVANVLRRYGRTGNLAWPSEGVKNTKRRKKLSRKGAKPRRRKEDQAVLSRELGAFASLRETV